LIVALTFYLRYLLQSIAIFLVPTEQLVHLLFDPKASGVTRYLDRSNEHLSLLLRKESLDNKLRYLYEKTLLFPLMIEHLLYGVANHIRKIINHELAFLNSFAAWNPEWIIQLLF